MNSPREWELYVEETKREPKRLPKDHPDAWMWEYHFMSQKEREELLHDLLAKEQEEQEALF